MTLTFERNTDSVIINQLAKYLDRRSCSSKVIVMTHTPGRVFYLDH